MSSLERKLVALLVGCKDLPPHVSTGVNDAYVSLRVEERYQRLREPDGIRSPPENSLAVSVNEKLKLANEPAFGDFTATTSPTEKSVTFRNDDDRSPVGSPSVAVNALRRQSMSNRRQSLRGNARGDDSSAFDPSLLETVINPLEAQKYQSDVVQSTSNPEYNQVFVFHHLQIPLRRRSQSVLLNNTLTGGSDPHVARQSSQDRHKINCKYFLRVDILDNTTVKGLGERFAFAEIPLDELPQGKRTTLWVSLTIDDVCESILRPHAQALESLDGVVETKEQLELRMLKYERHPKVGIVLEPVNFGVLPESVRNESADQAIWRALHEELGSVFSPELLRRFHKFLLAADDEGVETFTREDVVEMLVELYYFTGTPVPPDVDLSEEVQYLFSMFDRNLDDGVNLSELCGVLKMSKFALSLRPKWLVGKKLAVASAASIAGALWDAGCIPDPFEYAGYRKPNGSLYTKTKRPLPPKLPLYHVKPYVDMYKELYGNEEAQQAKNELLRLAAEAADDERRRQDEDDHKRGIYRDDTIPMFVPKSDKNRRYTAEREEKSLAILFAPSNKKSAKDTDLPTTFHENIDDMLIEHTSLQQCNVQRCFLTGCRVVGGRYVNCSFESCILERGVEIIDCASLRCCEISQCRIRGSEPVNCRMVYTCLLECSLIAQSSLFSCELCEGSLVVHSYLKECTLDPTVKDEGANRMEICRFPTKQKTNLVDQLLDHV